MAKKGCETNHRLNQRAPESGSKTTTVHDLQKRLDYYSNVHYYTKKKQEENRDSDSGSKGHAERNIGIDSKRKRARTRVQRGHVFHMYMGKPTRPAFHTCNIPMLKQL